MMLNSVPDPKMKYISLVSLIIATLGIAGWTAGLFVYQIFSSDTSSIWLGVGLLSTSIMCVILISATPGKPVPKKTKFTYGKMWMNHLEEFVLPRSKAGEEGLLIALAIVVTSCSLSFHYGNEFLWLLGLAAVSHFWFMGWVDEPRYETYRNTYRLNLDKLATHEILINLESKSMSRRTKQLLVSYLNKYRTNWSSQVV
ncbi:MAG: hypothetical protein ACI8Q1_003605 [Parvicella sp.]|jgi:hypothetical protein